MIGQPVPLPIRTIVANICGLHTSSDVARAQLVALGQRIPYLYAILAVNITALSYTHYHSNPMWQAALIPSVLVCMIGFRAIWWARLDGASLPDEAIRKILRSTIHMGCMMGVTILIWAISLHQSDSTLLWPASMTKNGHVDFFVGITVMSCIFLLMHLRLAAILLALIVVLPFSLYLLASGRAVETAIAFNLVVVTAAMLYVAVSFARDFERMVTTASDMQRLSTQNARLAAADSMTDLPNRRRFFHELDQAGLVAPPFAVIVVDLDGFKQVNDAYGHKAGDDVLRVVARRLQGLVPEETCLARLGGDEFACLVTGDQASRAAIIARAMIAACRTPVVCATFTANIGASAGICLSHAFPNDPVGVYERADYALFEAKRAGRGQVESFSVQHDYTMRRTSSIAHKLRSADLLSELTIVYQPLFAASNHQISSFEALIRWTSRDLGPVGPDEFIPIAERTDLIFDISRFVLRGALRQAAIWPDRISVKVNLSVRDLMSNAQTQTLLAELRQTNIAPSRVTFEVTETIFAKSLDVVRANVGALRSAGCRIAIDDFGVGYSNLNYIHALAPDVIKIDRCFVEAAATNEASRRIIRTIIELARNVGAESVAEGVETLAQALLLAEFGCDELQGYYFSKPVTASGAADMAKWGAAHDPARAKAPSAAA
jgi:diguanylate cyclase (GGDEF)-like protein